MADQQQPKSGYSCPIEGCGTKFSRKKDCERHVSEKHGEIKRCSEPGCEWKGARRERRVKEHRRKKHGKGNVVDLEVPDDFASSGVTAAAGYTHRRTSHFGPKEQGYHNSNSVQQMHSSPSSTASNVIEGGSPSFVVDYTSHGNQGNSNTEYIYAGPDYPLFDYAQSPGYDGPQMNDDNFAGQWPQYD